MNKVIKNITKELIREAHNESAYYAFGQKYFGPFLYGFTKWLYDSVKQKGCNKVFFFSRDGYMMKKAFDALGYDSISTSYVYFSRKSIRQALLHYTDTYEDSLRYLSKERFVSVGRLLDYYGFSDKEREDIAADHNLQLESDVPFAELKDNAVLKGIYTKYKEHIDERSLAQDKLLKQYLQQIGMSGDCVIVDIGWHGNMQYFLEEYCYINSIDIRFYGHYVGILPSVQIRGTVDGYLYNEAHPQLRKSALCFFGGYEKLFQSCEGSTHGYRVSEHNEVLPQLATYEFENEPELIDYISEWQDGAMSFVQYVIANDIQLEDIMDWARPLMRFGINPTLKGVSLFTPFYNVDGTKAYYVSQKPLHKYKPKELVHALSNSVWKTGFMKSVFKIPFPYFWIYGLLRR